MMMHPCSNCRQHKIPKQQFHLNEMITHLDGCTGCIPGISCGCCTAGAGCCPCVISWLEGITPWDRGAPGAPGGPPLPCIATGGPETPTQQDAREGTLLERLYKNINTILYQASRLYWAAVSQWLRTTGLNKLKWRYGNSNCSGTWRYYTVLAK
jgi:hypothetical protein